jgi:hypothetical protein
VGKDWPPGAGARLDNQLTQRRSIRSSPYQLFSSRAAAMQKFSEAYLKAKDVVEHQRFEKEWQTFLTGKCDVKRLYGDKGFAKGAAKSPDLIRARVTDMAKAGKSSAGHVIYDAAAGGEPNTAIGDRAATLKMVRHTYRIMEKGGQDVWVYSPPKDLPGWIFEVSTRDHRYDSRGLKPDKAAFPYAQAIDNADSWGYFALDLAGYLSKADHDNTWK